MGSGISRFRGALLLVLTLAAGIAIGMYYERQRVPQHTAARMSAHGVMDHFARELQLDSAQQQAVAAIFARRQSAVDSSWQALAPHVRQTLHLTLNEIAGILRPEQAAKYRQMLERRHPEALR
ncbi:MAG: hypothetical protein ACRENH_13685 [Gemmatimonadaceae bacterium]